MPPPNEAVVYGLNAALAVAAHRPQSILRVFHEKARRPVLGPLLKATAAARKPYREVEPEELERIAKTVHHEGVVVVTTPLELMPFEVLLQRTGPDALVVALDEVANPHNLGAILRSAAYFGATALLFPATPKQASLSAAAVRVAQGGAEVVPCCGVADLPGALRSLAQAGVRIVGAETRGGRPVQSVRLARPLCLVLGNEAEGLAPATRAACAERVSVPGSGAVESLNVSVAAGVLLAHVATPQKERPRR